LEERRGRILSNRSARDDDHDSESNTTTLHASIKPVWKVLAGDDTKTSSKVLGFAGDNPPWRSVIRITSASYGKSPIAPKLRELSGALERRTGFPKAGALDFPARIVTGEPK